jgi:CheY-like chemotaxis protein
MVTDVIMPGMSGRDLAERLLQVRPEIYVLYMSGYTADKALVSHEAAGEQTLFLQKPFTPRDFSQKIREILDMPPCQ